MPTTDAPPDASDHSLDAPPRRIAWVGGVVKISSGGPRPVSTPVAMWMTSGGRVLDAAIVTSGGPVVLREMFDELLTRLPQDERPTEVTVWPSVKARFRDIEYPKIEVRKDMFLRIVADDQADFGHIPHRLSRRSPST